MSNYAISLRRSSALIAALSFMAVLLAVNFSAFFGSTAGAAQLSTRSLTLSSPLPGDEVGNGTPGDETNGSEATHTFVFTAASAGTDVDIEYCTTAIGTCVAPTGLDLGSASASGGGSFADSAANTGTWTGTVNGGSPTTFVLVNVVNPTTTGTFFVRMVTSAGDDGTVASSITEGITITSKVAETLGFATTAAIDTTNVPDPTSSCTLTGSGAIALGDPDEGALSLATTYEAYSVFRLYTNAALGASVTYEGKTLTKDVSNDIDPIGGTAEAVNNAGTEEEFGLAVDGAIGGTSNHLPNSRGVGDEQDFDYVDNTADFDGTDGNIAIDAEYDGGAGDITTGTPAFAFVDDTSTEIASSNTFVNCATAAVRYVANIEPLTAAGTYTTTVVYSAVPTY